MTDPINVKLKPEQAAVITALQRLEAHINLEAAQLAQIYDQKGTAMSLEKLAHQLHQHGERYLRDVQTGIVIAHQMPVNGAIQP